MRWCFATPLSQRVPHFRAPQKYHRMSRFTTPYAQKTEHRMRSKRERWVGISPTHLARSTVFHGSPQSDNGGTICSRASERGRRFGVPFQSVRKTRSHRMKFCVQKGLGGAALNKQTAGNVSVYKHSHCLPDLCVAIHTHCLPDSKINETVLVPLRKNNRNLSIGR